MTPQEARIILLEDALRQSHHTISFLYGCLESPDTHKHAHPDQTRDRLKAIEELTPMERESCYHSFDKPGCVACEERKVWRRRHHEARQVLGLS